MGIEWPIALTAVFVEGIIFIILSVTKVREAVVNCIPLTLKYAVSAGIGMFIAFIGLVNGGLVVNNDATLVGLGDFASPKVIITIIGILIIVILNVRKVRGSMLWSILICSIIGWVYAGINPEVATKNGIFPFPDQVFKFEPIHDIAFKLDFSVFTEGSKLITFITIMLTFLFVDFFDTVGTLVGVASKANMLDANGNVPKARKALLVDAIGTTFGALIGVSTVTTYVESASGVAEGGRTGLTAVVTGVLFLLAMFLAPLFVAVPACATAPVLICIGALMMESIMKVDLKSFNEEYYKKLCGGRLEPVLKAIEIAAKSSHVEITTLLVSGENDNLKEVEEIAKFLSTIDKDIPLHLSRYFPRYNLENPPTDIAFMYEAEAVAKSYLNRVKLGNI